MAAVVDYVISVIRLVWQRWIGVSETILSFISTLAYLGGMPQQHKDSRCNPWMPVLLLTIYNTIPFNTRQVCCADQGIE